MVAATVDAATRASLEASLAAAVQVTVSLATNEERIFHIGRHLRAQAEGTPIPMVPTSATSDKEALRADLPDLSARLSHALNAAFPISAVAEGKPLASMLLLIADQLQRLTNFSTSGAALSAPVATGAFGQPWLAPEAPSASEGASPDGVRPLRASAPPVYVDEPSVELPRGPSPTRLRGDEVILPGPAGS